MEQIPQLTTSENKSISNATLDLISYDLAVKAAGDFDARDNFQSNN